MDLIGELCFFNRVMFIFFEKGFKFNAQTWPIACWLKKFSKSLYGCLFSAWSAGWHYTLCCVSSGFFISGMRDFCFRVGLVLPNVSADVTVGTIYVLAACSSHQIYKGSPWRLWYTSHVYKQQNINMTSTRAHKGAYRGRFKDAKKATFYNANVCVLF